MKMTRKPYNGCVDARTAEVRRVLDRYLVEVVERYDLCPWARPARLGGEVAIAVLFGSPTLDEWTAAARGLLARKETRVAMVVAPEIAATPGELRDIRNQLTARLDGVGIAEFHPDGIMDPTTAPRFVPALRRSPDPLLQCVPLSLLESVRGQPPVVDIIDQAQILAGNIPPIRGDITDDLAEENHARVTKQLDQFEAVLASIAEDRRTSYARAGITVGTGLSR
jgi:hypothetical protein